MDKGPIYAPFARPLYVMLKAVGAECNLACTYCYYTDKLKLYKDGSNPRHVMSEKLLEKFTKQYIEAQLQPDVLFTWHGGEALMRPIAFYQKAIDYQRKYANGHRIDNCIQTNGTLLNDDWCKFFRDNNFLVGVSIDGPESVHDAYRTNIQGLPSFKRVMKGIELLNKYGVQWNGMAVVNDLNMNDPVGFYNFFKSIECHFIQFAPIVERFVDDTVPDDEEDLVSPSDHNSLNLASFNTTPEGWGNFLVGLFDEWVKNDVGNYYIQIFDSTLANWVGESPGVCSMSKTCGHAGVMEYNGDVYCCDHYVFPEFKLGNINTSTLTEMMFSDKQLEFGKAKYDKLPNKCKQCKYLFACNGDCPKNRFVKLEGEENTINYLCEGYYKFFNHVAPYMDFMKNELLNKRAPANIMDAIKKGDF